MNHFLSSGLISRLADEAGHQQPGQHVEDRVIDLVGGDAFGFAGVVHVIDDHRADDARGRPGGEQAPVNGADELRAEDVGEIGRDGGEAAAIHRGDQAEGGRE